MQDIFGALFLYFLWIASVVIPLFIIYKFYVLFRRRVVAAEREAKAFEKIASNLGDSLPPR
jgi:hypothetical protein